MNTIRFGDKSEFVRIAQNILGINADGIFGAKTLEAVLSFQRRHSLAADGIVGARTWEKLLKPMKPVDYKQFSSGWKTVMYSILNDKSQTIGSSGCGPTALADIIATWFDAEFTPVEACALALEWNCRTKNSGTSIKYFEKAAQHWPFTAYHQTRSEEDVRMALKKGALCIARMGKGYWTNGGHYITLWQCDGKNFWACDPGSNLRSHAGIDRFAQEKKEYHIFTRR